MQFIRSGWCRELTNLFLHTDDVGTVILDAQRRSRLDSSCSFEHVNINGFDYFRDIKNISINGAGDTAYSRSLLDLLSGWDLSSDKNAEDDFTERCSQLGADQLFRYSLKIPASIAIYTDPRGTNARIRGGKRYGKYWEAVNNKYYRYILSSDFPNLLNRPFSIEEVATASGSWELPIDMNGNWKKNPIDVEHSKEFELIS